jgi:hypothetical protein
MDNQNNIQDELRSMNSSLPVPDSPTPFSVPEGYFDGLAERILAHVKEQNVSAADELQALSPLLAGLSKNLPYTVPEGYFEENAALPPFFLNEEESPVLAAIGKALPYTVPQGYFETVPELVMAKLVRPKAKVVPFFSRTWTKVAVAATIAGIVFIGGYRLLNDKPERVPAATAQKSAGNPGNRMAGNGSNLLQYIQNFSTEELDEFMNTVPVNSSKMQRATLAPTEKREIKEWLKTVPEKDIDAFLSDLPTADENLMAID